MPSHPFARPKGRIEVIEIESKALSGNLLGDPTRRSVAVYLPPGYDSSNQHYPLMVDLVGYTGSGLSHLNFKAYQESVPQRVDRLVSSQAMGPVIMAFPDCFTSLGGNQYINSEAMGDWADFLTLEMLPTLEQKFRVAKGREHRAVFGKSSGGYGSIIAGMRYADHWGAIACHSGDMAFELCYMRDFPHACDALARKGGVEGFLKHLEDAQKLPGRDFEVLMVLAMAATYDPDPDAFCGVRLPVDLRTCALDETRWAAWLAHDPVRLVEEELCQQNLSQLSMLFIDCGFRDQYTLHYGARQLCARLADLAIPHVYEEFDDTHSGIDYRMDRSLPVLYEAIGGK